MIDEQPIGALWIDQHRGQLQRRYGVGTFVAIYDSAVIDWGNERDTVRDRAAQLVGDNVYVGAVPAEPPNEMRTREEYERGMANYRHYCDVAEANPDQRRFPLDGDAFDAIGRLDITGTKTEFVDGIVVIDGVERRFSDHDYRLMIEHGLVPKDTVLIAGIIFRKADC